MTKPLTIIIALTLAALLGIFIFAEMAAFGQDIVNIAPPAIPVTDPLDMGSVSLPSDPPVSDLIWYWTNQPSQYGGLFSDFVCYGTSLSPTNWILIDTLPYTTNESVEIISHDQQYFLRFGILRN